MYLRRRSVDNNCKRLICSRNNDTTRIAILRRDNFRCQICSASIKDNKSVRLEVHLAKTFDDICKENNITTVKGALACKEIWSLDNGISLCHGCHKTLEEPKAKIRNIFV